MPMPSPSLAAAAAALASLLAAPPGGARAATLEVDWNIPPDRRPYAPLSGNVGDTVTFAYGPGHNVVRHPTGTCDATGGEFLGGPAGPTTYTFAEAGTHTFACDVSGGMHCGLGQIINITIADVASPDGEGGGEAPATPGTEEGEKEPAEAEGGGEEDDAAEDPGQGEGAEEATETDEDEGEVDLSSYSDFFNPGEEMRMLELRIKPYQIPQRTTTYTDFLFSLPDDFDELVHVVVGDVVITQPKHLHHFVLTGCTEPVDPDREGLPVPGAPRGCGVPLGGGWAAGGDFFGGIPSDAGAAFGPGLGLRSLNLNVHYTDGDEVDPALPNDGTHAIATDGVRILYTPTLRPRTVLYKPIINVGANSREMNIPPALPRQFYTKTCTVEPACLDTSDERMAAMDVDFTCAEVAGKCGVADDPAEGLTYALLCPVTCGACDDGRDRRDGGAEPAGFEIDAVNYHAHLLGREMYTTLLPKAEGGVPVDLASQELWIYDYQVTYPFRADRDASPSLLVYPGDKIQATCVYDSTEREDTTIFSLSTYDEMCITQLSVLVATPAVEDDDGVALLARLNAQSFNCAVDDDSDIWGGVLGPDEDGRDIWRDHPAVDADCTFPVGIPLGQGLSLRGDATPTFQTRCKAGQGGSMTGLCDGDVFNGAAIAGENQQNGVSVPYTCQQVEDMVVNGPLGAQLGAETVENLLATQWRPRCCAARARVDMCAGLGAGTVHDEQAVAGEECTGGSLDGADSHDASSYEAEGDLAFAEQCAAGGGASQSYTCAEVEMYYLNGPEARPVEELEFARTQIFQPKCCVEGEDEGEDEGEGEYEDEGEGGGNVPEDISGDDAGGETDAVEVETPPQEVDGVVPGKVPGAAPDEAEPSGSFASSPSLFFLLSTVAFFVGTL